MQKITESPHALPRIVLISRRRQFIARLPESFQWKIRLGEIVVDIDEELGLCSLHEAGTAVWS